MTTKGLKGAESGDVVQEFGQLASGTAIPAVMEKELQKNKTFCELFKRFGLPHEKSARILDGKIGVVGYTPFYQITRDSIQSVSGLDSG